MDEITVAVLLVMLTAAMWWDVRSNRIPNVLVLSGLIFGVLLRVRLGGLAELLVAIEGFAVGMVLLLPLYLLRAMGAGDVKLMGMVGAFLGPINVIGALFGTFLVGGVLAVVFALRINKLSNMLQNIKLILFSASIKMSNRQTPTMDGLPVSVGKLPYGVAIALGTLGFLMWQKFMSGVI